MKNYYVNYTIFKRNEIEFVILCCCLLFEQVHDGKRSKYWLYSVVIANGKIKIYRIPNDKIQGG